MKISVVIPVRNEEESIRALLDGLLDQSLPAAEILITDGGSSDATAAIVNDYAQRNPSVRLFREALALPGRGRNVAAANASYQWLAFIDAGVVPEPDWLAQLAAGAGANPDTDVVFGAWEPVTDTFFKECAAIAYAFVPNRESLAEVRQARAIFSSLLRRSVWERVGGFPEHLRSAEDHLFISKIEDEGFKISYAPAAVVRWTMQPTFGLTFKRFVTYSRNNLAAGLWREWQAAILIRYAVLLLGAIILAAFTGWWPIVLVTLLVLLLTARSLAALWRNRKRFPAGIGRNLRRLLLLIPILIVLDAATVVGTVDWIVRDKLRLGSAS
ncbi:MAG: glycosyl transferase family 2 [Acidobacteria bacterium]|nr:glycosyl transferase family 2 [Acidobacteriota bacterium]